MPESSAQSDGATPEDFVREFFEAMRSAGLEAPYSYDSKSGIFGDDERGRIDVRGLYLSIGGHAKGQREEALKKTAEFYVERPKIPADWSYAKPRIALTLVPQIAVVEHELKNRANPRPIPLAQMTPSLSYGLCFPVSIGTLQVAQEDLERWGVDGPTAFRQAAANLEKRMLMAWVKVDAYPGVYASPAKDGFDACRLFFPKIFSAVPLRGRPVVLLPTPSRVIFAGSEDEQGLVNLARFARTFVDKREGTLFLRPMRVGDDGRTWEDWVPPAGHAARPGLRRLQALQDARDYGQQAILLRLYPPTGGSLGFALPVPDVVEDDSGGDVLTVVVWDDGEKPAALPKADRIVFRREGKVLGVAPWERVVEKYPLAVMPVYPPRFAGQFPEDWQLQTIGLDPCEIQDSPPPPA